MVEDFTPGLPRCDRGLFIGALDDGFDIEDYDIVFSSWFRSVSFSVACL